MKSAGHEVAAYCRGSRAAGHIWAKSDYQGISQIYTPGIDRKSTSTLTFGLTGSVDALIRRFDSVIVLNVANGFYLPIIKTTKARIIVNVDGLEWERGKWNRQARAVFRAGARATAKYADHIVCDSRAVGSIWNRELGRLSAYIPYGADIIGPRPLHRIDRLGLKPQGYYLIVARVVPENNVGLLVEAHQLLKDGKPLIVVGSANYDHPTVRLLRSIQSANVRWFGHISDQDLLMDLWAHAAVYLHGHSVGGTNPALLQALAAGSPTLALRTPFNLEVLQNDEQLFTADPQELATKIMALASDPAKTDDVRRRGRRLIRERYRWSSVCEAYLKLCSPG